MPEDPLKTEQRRAQNRRAQANLRRKRQEQIEDLQEEIRSLKAQAQICSEQHQNPRVDYAIGGEASDLAQAYNYNNFQTDTGDIPSHLVEDHVQSNDLSEPTFNPFLSYVQQLPTPAYSSYSTARSTVIPGPSSQPAGYSTQNAVPTAQHHHCAFDALAKNASLLGIRPDSFLSTDSKSIFYCPLQSLATISESIKTLPLEFHPTMAQLSYPHQPWIDCIPLADLRSRIILAVSHRPPFLNSLDMWHDVLSDGLSCAADPTDAGLWTMSAEFVQRWQMLLRIDLDTLEAMCLASNPPVRKVSLPGPDQVSGLGREQLQGSGQ